MDFQLYRACRQGNAGLAKQLLLDGAETTYRDNLGNTPLHWAAYQGDINCCKLLVEHGADIYIENNAGRNPLCLAQNGGHEECVQPMLNAYQSYLKDSRTRQQ